MKASRSKKVDLVPIPSQTVGPYFAICLEGPCCVKTMAPASVPGERVKLTCVVFDRAGKQVQRFEGFTQEAALEAAVKTAL